MNQPLSTPVDASKSLIHWLVLSGVQTEASDEIRNWLAEPIQMAPTPSTSVKAPPVQTAPEVDIKFNTINELNDFLKQWKRLGLSKTATHTILGSGATNPTLMIICDTPDGSEDQKGEGFIGVGNRLICDAINQAGFATDTLYKTYLSKWRPPGQKPLSQTDIAVLAPLLRQEIDLVRPQAILAIGESTLRALNVEILRNLALKAELSFYKNQELNYEIPVLASQKGEFLVKTPGMKKSFWLSIITFATALRAKGMNLSNPRLT